MKNSFNPRLATAVFLMAALDAESTPVKTVPIIHGPAESGNLQLPSKGKRSRKRRAAKLRKLKLKDGLR